MCWRHLRDHSVHEMVEPLLAHRMGIGVLVLLGKLLELAALEGFFEVHAIAQLSKSLREWLDISSVLS